MLAPTEKWQSWQAPPATAPEKDRLSWINEACQEGALWHKTQRGFDDWLKSLDILSGRCDEKQLLEYRSNLTANRLKTNISVAIAGLAAIRPWGGFQASNPYDGYALAMNTTLRALYLSRFWDRRIKEVLQWAGAVSTGFIRPVYRRGMAGHGHGNIELDTFGMPSVLPVQMPSNGDYNRAYCVTLMDEKPIWEAHGMFPDYQDRLQPTNSKYWYAAEIRKASVQNTKRSFFNPFKPRLASEGQQNLIPIRYSRINDLAINSSGHTIPMGEPGASWSYDVPSFGAEMAGGGTATAMDARLYPYGRLIISSQNCIMYDGPCFNWDGELDLIPFCLDRWPWEPMGFSMVHDGYTLDQAISQIDRGTMDKIRADLDRPLAYNQNAVSKREANQVDLMQPRQRIAFDGDVVDKPFVGIAPDDVYKVSAESMAFRKELQADLDYTLQTRDIVELGKARALGKGMDQLEALVEANGPLVKDKSRSMEESVCKLAGQLKYRVLQYMDTARMIPYINEANIPEVFDYDPSSLVPSHLPGEGTVDAMQQPLASPTSRIQRARWWAEKLPFTLTAHSIHEIHQMTYRLSLMQLKQRGAPIAWSDILEACDVPDVRRVTGNTTQDRYYEEQRIELQEKIDLAKVAQGLGLDLNALMGAAGKKPEGRPPTGQQSPKLKKKGDGRSVISESG